jgi:hypothetical protein
MIVDEKVLEPCPTDYRWGPRIDQQMVAVQGSPCAPTPHSTDTVLRHKTLKRICVKSIVCIYEFSSNFVVELLNLNLRCW